jgi:hypothetical protein
MDALESSWDALDIASLPRTRKQGLAVTSIVWFSTLLSEARHKARPKTRRSAAEGEWYTDCIKLIRDHTRSRASHK